MHVAGFVLAGGASRRMGRDKALLEHQGRPLLAIVASRVAEVAGSVTVVGPPERYAHLGYPVEPDRVPGCGPMGGVWTALGLQRAPWNLIIACDFLNLQVEVLRDLVVRGSASDADCVAAAWDDRGPEPLCALYHARLEPVLARAIQCNHLKMRTFLSEVRTESVRVRGGDLPANLNTPEDWAKHA